jgi:predicted nucleic acid-binding protein
MVIKNLKNKLIFLDTAPLIYFIESHSVYQHTLKSMFEQNDDGLFRFITSSLTLLEVLVKPLKDGRLDIVESYRNILINSEGIDIIEVNNTTAIKAAHLRAKYNIHTPDAIQLATACEFGVDYFFTNDLHLKIVQEITLLTPGDLQA